ncbi:MAG: AEC family transporter [Clostridia bacterium]|nr:AEC family transporter [Clostridia bacterium]
MKDAFYALITIFLLMIPGFIFGKKNIITEEQSKGMSKFLMSVVLPLLIINSMQIDFEKRYMTAIIKILFSTFSVFCLTCVLAYCLRKILKMEKNYTCLIAFCLFFANTGGIGLPIINTIFGKEAVFYAGLVEVAVDILIFTVGIVFIQLSGENGRDGIRIEPKKILSPGFIGIVIGLALFFCNIKLPFIITNTFDKIGGASLPIAMFIIGYSLGKIKMNTLFADVRIYIITVAKMAVVPILTYIICVFIFRMSYEMSGVMTILMAMPTGSAAVIFSQEYNADYMFASKCVVLTTAASLITLIPLTMLIMSNV